jgi:RHS repeat-associated protein
VIKKASLAGFGGTTADYEFEYDDTLITRGAPHVPDYAEEPADIHVPLLTSIKLPDLSSYKMPSGDYDLTGAKSSPKLRGVITGIELPTGARIEWGYQGPTSETVGGVTRQLWYGYPKTSSARAYARASVGVRTRTVKEDGGTYVWTYDPYPEPAPGGQACVQGEFEPECSPKQFINRVTDPEGNYTKHYFSVFPHPFIPGTGHNLSEWHIGDYSLPFTKYQSGTDTTGKPVFLSMEYFKGNDKSETNPERQVYVRYESDKIPDNDGYGSVIETNRRVAATRTVYRDNEPKARFSEVQYLNFDGLGHYRRVVKSGNFALSDTAENAITEDTNYNPDRGRYEVNPVTNAPSGRHTYTKFPETEPWVLDTFTEKVVWKYPATDEDLSNSNLREAAKKEFYFNNKGLLLRQRTLKNTGGNGIYPQQDVNDLLVLNEYAADGTLSSEKNYGGDLNPISNGQLGSLALGTPERWVAHTYDGAGFLSRSEFKTSAGGNVTDIPYLVDQVVDPYTGLISKVTEASGINQAGLNTYLTFDTSGRLTHIVPDSGSKTVITYTPRTQGVERASATVVHLNGGGATLKTETYDYDHMGRLRTESREIETGQLISRRTLYNGMGWKVSETEWGATDLNSKQTEFLQFDMFGRPTVIRPADSKQVDGYPHDISLKYRGLREVERTVNVGTTRNAQTGQVIEEPATTIESYDVHGRLRGVNESSSSVVAQTFTGYEYDVYNRLRSVSSNGTQNPEPNDPAPRTNVAREGQATASSTANSNFPAASAINGDRKGLGWAQGTGGWTDGSQGNYSSDIVQVNFPGFKPISEIDVYTLRDNYARTDAPTLGETFSTADNTGQGITHFEVQYWSGGVWLTIPSGFVTNNDKVWRQFQFPEVLASAVRVQVYGSVKWASGNNYSRVVEIEAWGRPAGDTIWVDDNVPTGATQWADQETWNWVSGNPGPSSGGVSHQSAVYAGWHQHYFHSATQTLSVNPGETLMADVYIDPANLPRELMLQWNDGTWEHRAYWGEDLLPWGTNGTTSRRYMGPLPEAARWVRLEVPASEVGLDGRVLNGMAFTMYGGRATWDRAGKKAATPQTIWSDDSMPAGSNTGGTTWAWVSNHVSGNFAHQTHSSEVGAGLRQHVFQNATQTLTLNSGDRLFAYVYLDPANPPSEVMMQWLEPGSWEHRAYWKATEGSAVPWGVEGANSKRYMGKLPAPGQWARLEVPAALVGLEGKTINGMAFTHIGGQVTWDYAGKAAGAANVNHALQTAGAAAWASSQFNASYPVSAVIDGERLGNNWGLGGYGSGWNDATQNDFSCDWLQVTFTGNKTIDEIDVFTLQTDLANPQEPTLEMTFNNADNTGFGITDFEVQYLEPSTGKWMDIPNPEAHVTGNNKIWRQFKFPAITTGAIRVAVHGAVRFSKVGNNYSRIVEVEAWTAQQALGSKALMAEATTTVTQTRTFIYDNRGFLLSESHPELGTSGNGTVTYSNHDSLGNVGNKSDGVNQLRYTYDPVARRLTDVDALIDDEPDDTIPDSTPPQWRPLKDFYYHTNNDTSANGIGYGFGKLSNAVRHNWNTNPYTQAFADLQVTDSYRYKGVGGRVSRKNTAFSTGPNFVQTYTYTDLGNVSTQTYPEYSALPNTRQLTYTYANGLVTKIAGAGVNYASGITYNNNGMLATVTHSNGVKDLYAQDPNRMQRVYSIWTSGVAGGYNLADDPYAYDGGGNITKIASNWYLYDKVQRLKEGTTINGTWKKQYEYDEFGNIPRITTTKPGQAPSVFSMEINATKNRLGGTIQYDAAGNALGVSPTAKIYRYDALNMMKTVPERLYYYDANDQRVMINENQGTDVNQFVNVWMLRGLNNELMREYRSTANWSWSRDHIYFAGKLISAETASAGRLEYHTDHLGSPRMITNTSAQQVAVNYLFPFGEPTVPPEQENFYQAQTRLKFTGHERDFPYPGGGAHTLDYMHARYYLTDTARFLSIDSGRDFNPAKPQSWNLYAYVRNNPINASDPTGRQFAGPLTVAAEMGRIYRAQRDPYRLVLDCRVLALLDSLAYSEGTARDANNGYGTIVRGKVLSANDPALVGQVNATTTDFTQHPNALVQLSPTLSSTAAGRYQFLNRTWTGLHLPDFTPQSQDIGGVMLMLRRNMVAPLLSGNIQQAVTNGNREWASLPGSPYGQPTRTMAQIEQTYAGSLFECVNSLMMWP